VTLPAACRFAFTISPAMKPMNAPVNAG